MATKTKKSVRFGSIQLPINQEETPFVPTSKPYKENGKILETLAYAVKEDMPTLLIGETGVGKTSAVRYLASRTNNSLRRVNVNGSMTAEDFVGQMLYSPERGTYWKDGVLTEAMRNGYWIVIDEINAASAEILFVLHSLMDDDRYIVLTDHPEREVVRAHPNFRIFATMNPPERYAGTQDMNKALLSRFAITLNVPIPPPAIELGVISGASDTLGEAKAVQFMSFIDAVRGAYNREELDVFISPRDTANIVRLFLFTGDLAHAIALSIASRGSEADRKAIMSAVKMHLGGEVAVASSTKKAAVA